MNWKFNYWTLLTLAFGVLLGYQNFIAPKPASTSPQALAQEKSKPDWLPCHSNVIPDSVGQKRASNYKTKWADKQPVSLQSPVCNANIRTFLLAKCELLQMLNETGARDSVFATLALNPGNGTISGQKDTIDLIFRVFSDATHSKYYDFSNPCPPLCGGSGGGSDQ